MIFNEIYSVYYRTMAKIIEKTISCGNISEREIKDIVDEYAFKESILTILPAIKEEKWQLLSKDLSTPIQKIPTMPLSNLQKQWLKAILSDPRIKLFDIRSEFLNDVEPLFTNDDYRVFDKYSDGDPFDNDVYIENFKLILKGIKEKTYVKAEVLTKKKNSVQVTFMPVKLEYSEKDDKFRVIVNGCKSMSVVKMANIIRCEICSDVNVDEIPKNIVKQNSVTLKITDRRNALERCLLHFTHFEKKTEKIDKDQYIMKLKYDRADENEIVIRILQFGPMIEVISPPYFRELIRNRLKKQLNCELD